AEWLGRWFSLRHSQDEAIEGLRQLPRVSFPIFGRDFAVAPLTLASAIGVPIILLLLAISPSSINWFVKTWGLTVTHEPSASSYILTFLELPISWFRERLPDLVWKTMVLTVSPASFFVGAIIFVIVARYFASIVSRLLSAALDRVAWRQIRASA